MANHKSSEKRARQDVKKRDRNKSYLSGVKTSLKSFQAALGKGDAELAAKLLHTTQSSLGKAVSKGILHKNTVSRKVSRLTKALHSLTEKS